MKVIVEIEDKDTLEWIMRNFVESIREGYSTNDCPAVTRAKDHYNKIMAQVGGKTYFEMYEK